MEKGWWSARKTIEGPGGRLGFRTSTGGRARKRREISLRVRTFKPNRQPPETLACLRISEDFRSASVVRPREEFERREMSIEVRECRLLYYICMSGLLRHENGFYLTKRSVDNNSTHIMKVKRARWNDHKSKFRSVRTVGYYNELADSVRPHVQRQYQEKEDRPKFSSPPMRRRPLMPFYL